MTTYSAGIVRRPPNFDAWVFELPGCRAVGGSVEEVAGLLPVVIAEYQSWLRAAGEAPPDQGSVDFKVVEDVDSSAEFCFKADRAPLGQEDLERGIELVQRAHADFVAVIRHLPDAVLDWKPPASAVKIDAIYPDVRSIRDMASHVATAMSFHIRGVGDVATRVPDPPHPDLQAALETTVARLRTLSDEERAGTVYKRSGPRGEAEWSARKSIRRLVNHIRFHTREVEQRLCWLALGVPEILPASRE